MARNSRKPNLTHLGSAGTLSCFLLSTKSPADPLDQSRPHHLLPSLSQWGVHWHCWVFSLLEVLTDYWWLRRPIIDDDQVKRWGLGSRSEWWSTRKDHTEERVEEFTVKKSITNCSLVLMTRTIQRWTFSSNPISKVTNNSLSEIHSWTVSPSHPPSSRWPSILCHLTISFRWAPTLILTSFE